jgi:hypothetical protein
VPTDFESVKVKCPYYISSSEKKAITCEGVIRGTTTQIRFRRFETKGRYMKTYCDSLSRYGECRIAAMLDGKGESK